MSGKATVTMKQPEVGAAEAEGVTLAPQAEVVVNVGILWLSKCPEWIAVVILALFGLKIAEANVILALWRIQMNKKNYVKVYMDRKARQGMFALLQAETEIFVQTGNASRINQNQAKFSNSFNTI